MMWVILIGGWILINLILFGIIAKRKRRFLFKFTLMRIFALVFGILFWKFFWN